MSEKPEENEDAALQAEEAQQEQEVEQQKKQAQQQALDAAQREVGDVGSLNNDDDELEEDQPIG